jgi:hypothetical protein
MVGSWDRLGSRVPACLEWWACRHRKRRPTTWALRLAHKQAFVIGCPPRLGSIAEIDLGVPPPIMKSFKEFLLSLDDSVDETEAVKRYNDYKLDFRRQQMQDFFLAHKDEEW